jgi:hypothetical protein
MQKKTKKAKKPYRLGLTEEGELLAYDESGTILSCQYEPIENWKSLDKSGRKEATKNLARREGLPIATLRYDKPGEPTLAAVLAWRRASARIVEEVRREFGIEAPANA